MRQRRGYKKMLKAKTNTGDIIFGLSKQNIRKLKEGKPILINLEDLGLEKRRVMIFYGDTEKKMQDELNEYGYIADDILKRH